jgi:V-type H+-transporting ATPase subunit H
MSFRNLLAKGAFAAQMIDLGLPHIVQNLKAQAWSDEVNNYVLHKFSC